MIGRIALVIRTIWILKISPPKILKTNIFNYASSNNIFFDSLAYDK